MNASAIVAFGLVVTLTFDLENLFSSANSRGEYLWQVLKFLN